MHDYKVVVRDKVEMVSKSYEFHNSLTSVWKTVQTLADFNYLHLSKYQTIVCMK